MDDSSAIRLAMSAVRGSRYDESRCEGTVKYNGRSNPLGEPDTHDGMRASAMVSDWPSVQGKM